jgi:hypothetical protein
MTLRLPLTKRQKQDINDTFYRLAEEHSTAYTFDRWAHQERTGYGMRRDRVTLHVARALCVKWFLMGVHAPDMLLRDTYAMRGAAIYMVGLGALTAHQGRLAPDMLARVTAMVEMYDAVFAAHLAAQKGA